MQYISFRFYKQWENPTTPAVSDVVFATNVWMECHLLLMSTIKFTVLTTTIECLHPNVLRVEKVSYIFFILKKSTKQWLFFINPKITNTV